jgi:uncharacterized damage-inducible protein DinB
MLVEHPGPRKYLLGALETAPEIFRRLLQNLSDEEADFRPDPERFTLREAIAHVADWDAIFLTRMKRTRDEDTPFLPDIDEGQLALDHGYALLDPMQQVQVLAERRALLVDFARGLAPEEWQRVAVHERAGRLTLEGLATLVALHDTYHVRQAVQWREAFARR